MSNKVELFSTKTFTVYKELSFVDKSLDIEKAKIVNTGELIRVLPTWTSVKAKIKKGTHQYDVEVLSWPTVRGFIKQGIIKVISGDYEKEFNVAPEKKTKVTKGQSLESLVPEEN
jgi:hypothetical protein